MLRRLRQYGGAKARRSRLAAAQIPLVTALTLLTNRRLLPPDLQPPWWILAGGIAAAIFSTVSAGVYLGRLAAGGG